MRLPGDKSLAHRALLCAALADTGAPSRVRNVPDGADVACTIRALRALGTRVSDAAAADVVDVVPAPWRTPDAPLDCGNSGTLARLLIGALAGARVGAVVVGDASLSRRPMRRVSEPLRALCDGVDVVTLSQSGTLPATVRSVLPGDGDVVVDTGVASAQVKSALIFASRGRRRGAVTIREPTPTRDHTERMLRALGAPVELGDDGAVRIRAPLQWRALDDVTLAGDPSSAALLAVGAVVAGRAVRFDDVLLGPRRDGFWRALARAGVDVVVSGREQRLGESVGDVVIQARPAAKPLRAVAVGAGDVADLIDELPALAAIALVSEGETRVDGAGELRVKESDRLARLVDLCETFAGPGAAAVDGAGDALIVRGSRRAPLRSSGRSVNVRTDGDHRIAMAALALGRAVGADVVLDDPGCVSTSFPGFARALDEIVRPQGA